MDVSSTRNTIPLGRESLRLSRDTLHDFTWTLRDSLHEFTWTLRDSLHTLHGLYVTLRGLYVISRKLT